MISPLDRLSPDQRRELMEAVARAYLSGVPVSEFYPADCPVPRWGIWRLYHQCLKADGELAPRCRYCPDKHVAHKGKCRKARPRPPDQLPPQQVEACCPCCGSSISRETLAIDLTTNTIAYRGWIWRRVQPQLVVFAYSLAQAWPRPATSTDICFALWGVTDGPEHADRILKQYASRLRAVLHGTGVELRRGPRPGSYVLWLPGGTVLAGEKPDRKDNGHAAIDPAGAHAGVH